MKRRTSLSLISSFVAGLIVRLELPSLAIDPVPIAPSAPLNIKQLIQLLDRNQVAAAVELVEQGWNRQYEAYYGGKLSLQLLSAAQISQRLQELFRFTGLRSALLYAIPTPEHLELILLAPGKSPIHRRVAVSRESLLDTVKAFQEGILLPARNRSRYLIPGQQLDQWLIAPVASELAVQTIDSLIFCLGGGLRTVPLAALHDGNRFLVERYNLAIIPAFNLLDHRPAFLKDAKVLAMGASEFGDKPALPAVPLELSTIADTLWSGTVLLNQTFTPENLRSQRQKDLYRIVHLATHADFAPGSVRDSYIQFWNQRVSLDLVQTLNLRFPEVQLLVLSACNTAVGDPQAELGFAGVAVMSGSKAVLASLWQVSDVGTLFLMTEFYRQLKSLSKTQALRKAQIAMLNGRIGLQTYVATVRRSASSLPTELIDSQGNDFSHPYYWAAFTIIGNSW